MQILRHRKLLKYAFINQAGTVLIKSQIMRVIMGKCIKVQLQNKLKFISVTTLLFLTQTLAGSRSEC